MDERAFDGSDPISVLGFLATLKSQLDENGISEGSALLILPSFLKGDAKEAFLANFDVTGDLAGGFNSWPHAVQFLLRSYAKDIYIEKAAAEIDQLTQKDDEDEVAYARRLKNKARVCAGVYTERDLVTRLVRGLRPDLKPMLSLNTFDRDGRASFMDYVEHATALGDAHRALERKTTKTKVKTSGVLNIRKGARKKTSGDVMQVRQKKTASSSSTSSSDSSSDHSDDADAVMLADVHPAPPSITSSDVATSSDALASQSSYEPVYAVQPNRNPRLPPYAPLTKEQRPGWVVPENLPSDICFECFALGHKKPNCPHLARTFSDPAYRQMLKANYFRLTREQKEWLAAIGRTPAFALRFDEAPDNGQDQASVPVAPQPNSAYPQNNPAQPSGQPKN